MLVPTASSGSLILEEALVGQWMDIYHSAKEQILVGLCDPTCSPAAIGILQNYAFSSTLREAVFSEPRLVATMRTLYTPIASFSSSSAAIDADNLMTCQRMYESFLYDVCENGYPCNAAVVHVLSSFSKNFTGVFEKSISLQKLLKELASTLDRK